MEFATIEQALKDIYDGKIIIVVDDEDRENEGDFVCAAEKVTPEIINFMATYGRGLICSPITEARARHLHLDLMTENNDSLHETPFTISVDYTIGTTTGISSFDRAKTLRALADEHSIYSDFARPGHIFPLRARPGGVLEREGHTEAAVDLTRLAGLCPAGVIVEIMNDDGTMARIPDLEKIAQKWGLHIVTIKDLIEYRKRHDPVVEKITEAEMPTQYGDFRIVGFREKDTGIEQVALVKGTWEKDEPIMVRIHSECATGDIFASKRCDCGDQLHAAMTLIEKEGKGVILYLKGHEGRGIGLLNKIRAYKLQENGMDTVQANIALGFQEDERDYRSAYHMLSSMGISKIRLLSNNPTKFSHLAAYHLEITERIPLEISPNDINHHYLQTKRDKMGHMILGDEDPSVMS